MAQTVSIDVETSAGTVRLHELLVEDLKALGVEVVFGLMSDDTLGLAAGLETNGIAFLAARHETQAVVMAEGYSFATGRLGVALVGRGPAATNALSGSVFASRTGSKVLIILGDDPVGGIPVNGSGPDMKAIGGGGAASVFAAAGVRSFWASTASIARNLLAEAAAHAALGNAASLHLPTSIQNILLDPVTTRPTVAAPRGAPPAAVDQTAIDAAIDVLSKSERPLIIAGWGAHLSGAREAVERLADRIGAVVVTTLRAKDMFDGYAYNAGVIGSFSHSAGRRLIEQTDAVLAVGAGLNFLTMSHGTALPPVPIVHVDTRRAHIGRWQTVQVAVVGDAKLVCEQLVEGLPSSDRAMAYHTEATRKSLAGFRHTDDFTDESKSRAIDPRSLAVELDTLLPKTRTVVYDSGNSLLAAAYFEVPGPGHIKTTADSGSIALAFGVAIGAARGRPGETTVLVVGDGALLMSLSELETVPRLDIPLVVVVMNDHSYGAERHLLEVAGFPTASSMFPECDFAELGAALGYEAHTVASLDELRALAHVLAAPSAPILLNCLINGEVRAPFITEFANL